MLNFYRQHSANAIEQVEPSEFSAGWVFGSQNHQAELDEITDDFSLDANIVRDVLDIDELARIEYDQQQNMYLFLRLINFDVTSEAITYPLLVVVARKNFISLTAGPATLIQKAAENNEFTDVSHPAQTLVEFMRVVISGYDKALREAAKSVQQSQDLLKGRLITDNDFFRFVEIESQLYEYQQNLSNTLVVVDRLRDNAHQLFNDRQLETLTDLSLQIKQLQARVDANKQKIISICKINKTISDNSLNHRMKILTVSTLLLAIPNMFYGMYGMNVALPFQNHPAAFFGMVAATVSLTLLLIILAYRSKMF